MPNTIYSIETTVEWQKEKLAYPVKYKAKPNGGASLYKGGVATQRTLTGYNLYMGSVIFPIAVITYKAY